MTHCGTRVYSLPGLCLAFFVPFFYHHFKKELVYSIEREA